jgi:hypothetical protein
VFFKLTSKRNFVAYDDHLLPRGGFMSSTVQIVSLPASGASTDRGARQGNRIDPVTGNCGLDPPILIQRIGTMTARACQPLPRPRQATPTASRPEWSRGPTAGCGWGFDKPSGGVGHFAKTTATPLRVQDVSRARPDADDRCAAGATDRSRRVPSPSGLTEGALVRARRSVSSPTLIG